VPTETPTRVRGGEQPTVSRAAVPTETPTPIRGDEPLSVTPAQGRERGRSTTPKGNWLAFQQGETPINPAGAQALTEGT
jgi:hypothetical protein